MRVRGRAEPPGQTVRGALAKWLRGPYSGRHCATIPVSDDTSIIDIVDEVVAENDADDIEFVVRKS